MRRFVSLAPKALTRRAPISATQLFAAPPRAMSTSPSSVVTELARLSETDMADHSWRQTNHIWTDDELRARIATATEKHVPQTFSDRLMHFIVKQILYRGFNYVTGYTEHDPTPQSIEWRLIVLESFAGVPGFVAAGFRHFRSLRTLRRDHGFIYTLLEEAENERMHLLVCMKMFRAGGATKALVLAAQLGMTPFLMAVHLAHPPAMHRFVGYLEETAVHTYASIVRHCETPGTRLHSEWGGLAAPPIAIAYWKMDDDATWVDTLKRMLADEAHHRDINHTFASLPPGDTRDNPFAEEHMHDFDRAVRRRAEHALKEALHATAGELPKTRTTTPLA